MSSKAKQEATAQNGGPINEDANPNAGGVLNPDAPVASQESDIRDAKFPDEKASPDTIAQIEEIA